MFICSFLRRGVIQESKENQPDSFGDAQVSNDNQPNSFGEDAPVTRREMERWERDGRIEMETRERHIRDEFREVPCQFEAMAGNIDEVAHVADRVEISGQMNQPQRMVQQFSTTTNQLLLLRQLRTSTYQVGVRANGRYRSLSWTTTSRCGGN